MKMKHIIIYPQNNGCIEVISEYINLCDEKSRFCFLCTDEVYDKCHGPDTDTFVWQTREDWKGFIDKFDQNKLTQSLSELLHKIADILLYSGEPIKLYSFLPQVLTVDCLELYGAFYRLKTWHNMKLIFITSSDALSQSVLELTEFLDADITDEMKYEECDEDVVWMGKISLMNKVEDKGYQFPGFRLSSADRASLEKRLCFYHKKDIGVEAIEFGRMIEILDIIDMSTQPTFLLTSLILQLSLHIDNTKSKLFLQDFNSYEDGVAYVGRLATYSIHNVVTGGRNQLKTAAWKELIMTDISCIQEPDEETLPGLEYLHFIITGDREDNTTVKLTVLKSPRELNSNVLNILENSSYILPDKDDVCERNFVSSLPTINHLDLPLLHDHLNQLQVGLLHEWIDEREKMTLSTRLTQKQLCLFLEKTQELFVKSIFETFENTSETFSDTVTADEEYTDSNMDSTTWPERLALQYQESKQKTIKRFKSSESMPLSSPFHPQDSGTSLDAVEFLRFFQPDGSAVNDKMSPVRKKPTVRTVRRISSHDSLTSWPESKNVNYHDVYYYSKQEDMEFAKVRDKFMKEETYCSVFVPSYGNPKSKKSGSKLIRSSSGHILSPTRRSPRGKKRKQTFEGICSQPSTSMKRPNIGLKTPSKMAQRQLKSPRKLVNLPSRRCSPRKNLSSSKAFSFPSSQTVRKLPAPVVYDEDSSFGSFSSTPVASTIEVRKKTTQDIKTVKTQESRSQRHRRKLVEICCKVLELNGINKDNPIFKSCSSNLYEVTKIFIKALPNAHSLSQEMRRIAEQQVLQVIDLEKRRQELSQKKKKVQF